MNHLHAEFIKAVDEDRKTSRQKILDVGHYAINNDIFYQGEIANATGIPADSVSRAVSRMNSAMLLETMYTDRSHPGRPRPMMAANTEKLEPLLDTYNTLHIGYLADILGASREDVIERGVKSTLVARGLEDSVSHDLLEASEALKIHPLTTVHLGIHGVAAAVGLPAPTLHSRTKV